MPPPWLFRSPSLKIRADPNLMFQLNVEVEKNSALKPVGFAVVIG
jgi:hypothetical protein